MNFGDLALRIVAAEDDWCHDEARVARLLLREVFPAYEIEDEVDARGNDTAKG